MKATTFFFVIVAMVCSMAVTMTSCSSDDDEVTDLVSYEASGTLSASNSTDALEAIFGISQYTEAIKEALGGDYVSSDKDKEVISACDAVYQNHRTNHPSWEGKITIRKYRVSSSESEGTVVKTYTY